VTALFGYASYDPSSISLSALTSLFCVTQIWSTSHLAALYVIHPHGDTDSGDLFSLAYSPTLRTLYLGCQNTSLQWIDLSHPEWYAVHPLTEMTGGGVGGPAGLNSPRKFHKFFDSQPRGSSNAIPTVASTLCSDPCNGLGLEGSGFQLSRSQSATSLGGDAKTDSIGSSSATLVAHTAPAAKPSPHILQVLPSNVIESAHYG
jgi:di- and tripeptidase